MLVALVVSAAQPRRPEILRLATATAIYGGGGNFLWLATAYELYGGGSGAYRLSSIKGEEKDVGITKKIHDVYSTIKIKDTDPL